MPLVGRNSEDRARAHARTAERYGRSMFGAQRAQAHMARAIHYAGFGPQRPHVEDVTDRLVEDGLLLGWRRSRR